MPVCPECDSRDLIKFGKYYPKKNMELAGNENTLILQKWHCLNCKFTTMHPRTRKRRIKGGT